MFKIKDIIEFLRLDRRYEGLGEQKSDEIIVEVIDSINPKVQRIVKRSDFENESLFKRIHSLIESQEANAIYIQNLANTKKFFVKLKDPDNEVNFLNLENNCAEWVNPKSCAEWVNPNSLEEIVLDYATNQYFYDYYNKEVVSSLTDLDVVTPFDDRACFDPKALDIQTDEYLYDYEKPVSTFGQITNIGYTIVSRIIGLSDKSELWTKVDIYVKQQTGTIFLIPKIEKDNFDDTYIVTYYYAHTSQKLDIEINESDVALRLTFKKVEPFLAFLNKTIFSQSSFDYNNHFGKKLRLEFIDDFDRLIIEKLERDLESGHEYFITKALRTLYYLTNDVAITIGKNALWNLLELIIAKGNIQNTRDVEAENILIKLLETIATKERSIDFLNGLLSKVGQKKEVTCLEFLFTKLDGENKTAFDYLVNRMWRQTEYFWTEFETIPSFKKTNGPSVLPYESEKHLGFYFSNASVTFDAESQIVVNLETGETETKLVKHKEEGVLTDIVVTTEIIKHYTYHPYYPIYIKDIEKQETALEMDATVPAFMLLANRNEQFWSNVITATEYTIDALMMASGIGNIMKFNYLISLGKTYNVFASIKLASGVIDFAYGALDAGLKIADAEKSPTGILIKEYLFWLSLLSLSTDIVATKIFKNGLQKTAQKIVGDTAKIEEFEQQLEKFVKNGIISSANKEKLLRNLKEVAGNFKIENYITRNAGKAIKEIKKDFIIQQLKGATATATEVSEGINAGTIKLSKLSKEDLLAKVKEIDPKCKNPENVVATQKEMEIFILKDRGIDKAFGEIVHEGKHVLDERISIAELREETKLIVHDKISMKSYVDKMTDKQVIELRARIAEREFQQVATPKQLDFSSVPEMISFIFREY